MMLGEMELICARWLHLTGSTTIRFLLSSPADFEAVSYLRENKTDREGSDFRSLPVSYACIAARM